jgi:hypothetical protein
VSNISDLRSGLATNLATISGLRTSVDLPDNPNPPVAVIGIENVNYDQAFAGGLVEYNFRVTVLASRASDRMAQRRLDTYTSTETGSVKLAIESDKTLGGNAFDVRVTEMSNIGTVSLGEISYLAADFTVTVYAD